MEHSTHTAVTGYPDPESFAEQILGWLDDYAPLAEALGVLRQLGDDEEAMVGLLDSRPVKKLRLSWELWDALVAGDGSDPEQLLSPQLGEEWYSWLRFMVWGVPLPTEPNLVVVR